MDLAPEVPGVRSAGEKGLPASPRETRCCEGRVFREPPMTFWRLCASGLVGGLKLFRTDRGLLGSDRFSGGDKADRGVDTREASASGSGGGVPVPARLDLVFILGDPDGVLTPAGIVAPLDT
mmetsp:Transcript_50999/g.109231  ORF Transcript_50999/g.109231 Transcript_50999/m.109231 type:complete len:122 (-) Transcript_50999:92-457(-)